MVFIETSVFTRQIEKLISDESYLEMQQFLSRLPTAGDLIRGSNGCRKLRWNVPAGTYPVEGKEVEFVWSIIG